MSTVVSSYTTLILAVYDRDRQCRDEIWRVYSIVPSTIFYRTLPVRDRLLSLLL